MKIFEVFNRVMAAIPASTLALCTLSLSHAGAQTLVNIDVPGSSATSAQCISDSDGIAGWYLDSSGSGHAFLNVGGKISTFDMPGSAVPNITRMNTNNDVVGWYVNNGTQNAFLRKASNSKLVTIQPPNAAATYATSIDGADDVGGYYRDTNDVVHGFFYVNAQNTYLTVDYPGASLTRVEDMNYGGTLVGFYRDINDKSHGFYASFGPDGPFFESVDYPNATGTELYRIATGSSMGEINTTQYVIGEYGLSSGAVSGFIQFGPGGYVDPLTPSGYVSSRPVSFVGNGNVATEIPVNPTQKQISATVPRTGSVLKFGAGFSVASSISVSYPGAVTTQIKDANHNGVVIGYYLDNAYNVHSFSFNSQQQ